MATPRMPTALKWSVGAIGLAVGSYAVNVGLTWLRYGHPAPAAGQDVDPLLDQFMPTYDVAERHHIQVAAPAPVTFAAACEQDLMAAPLVRAVFKAREIAGRADAPPDPGWPRARAGQGAGPT